MNESLREPLDVAALIDAQPVGPQQKLAIALCGLVVFLDGFDTQAIALVVPALAPAWSIDPRAFGPVFGAGLLGALFGAIALGGYGDRAGRRTALLVAVFVFGAGSLATLLAHGFPELIGWRFVTGIGLGGALPNAVAITAEYAPRRMRATLVSLMYIGFPLGAVTAGLAGAALIPAYGWQVMFVVGGLLPLAMLPVFLVALPESLRHLVLRGAAPDRVRAILRRIAPDVPTSEATTFSAGEGTPPKASVGRLFSRELGTTTLLLWLLVAANQFVLLLLANWLPALLHGAGMGMRQAIASAAALNLGGVIGAVVLARLIDASGARKVLVAAYFGGAVLTAALGFLGGGIGATLALVAASGFCIVGGQIGANALAASIYPTAVRGTGVGWAVGIGRVGAILGPVAGGVLLSRGAELATLFGVAGVGALVCALALVPMRGGDQR